MEIFLCAQIAEYTDVVWLLNAGAVITSITTFHLKLP